ncbi:uncharacterized protein TNCV_206991 [Trichonephila clavipes]|nr:uncharacterized protein TNCV_206991 [Trichonephila clavipes]
MKIKTLNPELLRNCLHGGTQNPNGRVNNVIWSRVPKKIFVLIEALSLGTCDAISSFKMGTVSKLEILRKLNSKSGDYTVLTMKRLDKKILLKAKYSCLQKTKEEVLLEYATFMDNVSEHVDITELEVKLKKIDQLQRKIEELKELLLD